MTIYEKLHKVQQTLKAPKNQYNSFGKYKYRSCEDILEGLKKPLSEVGCIVVIEDEIVAVNDRVYVKATSKFIDNEGNTITNTAYARESAEKKGLDDSQLTGATSSYARKYSLNGLFLIDDTKDADTEENANERKSRPTEQDMKNVENKKIDATKQKALMSQCEKNGVNPDRVLSVLKVKSFEDITEKQFSWVRMNWSKEIANGN